MRYLVSYESGPEDPSGAIGLLGRLNAQQLQTSLWIVESANSLADLRDVFRPLVSPGDRLFIMLIPPGAQYVREEP